MELKDKFERLAKQLNYRGKINNELFDALINQINKYSENEIYVFFKEAPAKLTTFPKPKDITKFFKDNPVKKQVQRKTLSGCNKCSFNGSILLFNKDYRPAVVHCDCELGRSFASDPKVPTISKEYANKLGYFLTNSQVLKQKYEVRHGR